MCVCVWSEMMHSLLLLIHTVKEADGETLGVMLLPYFRESERFKGTGFAHKRMT